MGDELRGSFAEPVKVGLQKATATAAGGRCAKKKFGSQALGDVGVHNEENAEGRQSEKALIGDPNGGQSVLVEGGGWKW